MPWKWSQKCIWGSEWGVCTHSFVMPLPLTSKQMMTSSLNSSLCRSPGEHWWAWICRVKCVLIHQFPGSSRILPPHTTASYPPQRHLVLLVPAQHGTPGARACFSHLSCLSIFCTGVINGYSPPVGAEEQNKLLHESRKYLQSLSTLCSPFKGLVGWFRFVLTGSSIRRI